MKKKHAQNIRSRSQNGRSNKWSENFLTKDGIACCAVTEDLNDSHHSSDSQCFSVGQTTNRIAPSHRGSQPPSNISRSVRPFLRSTSV